MYFFPIYRQFNDYIPILCLIAVSKHIFKQAYLKFILKQDYSFSINNTLVSKIQQI